VSSRRFVSSLTAAAALAIAAAAPASAAVQPGAQTFTDGAQCTSNFVFADGAGGKYLGQAAHCAGTGAATDTNGCDAGSLPLGTAVEIDGAARPGTLAYSSWLTMQGAGESDPDTCQYNDFALIRLDPADAGSANPSIPFWGGPTGLRTTGTGTGEKVLSYGNSSLRAGVTTLSPKEGASLGSEAGGWNHPVYTVTPGVPGDSGSAFIDGQGRAFGTLSTLALAPLPASNGVSDLNLALSYMRSHGGPDARLVPGSAPFRGPLLP
jgi:hypothetical protein